MNLNSDFSQRALVHYDQNPWQASPAAGVERKMLDWIGDEVARATTIVRFAPNSAFDRHTHHGGEEFIVLEGVFQDESGDFPAGSYVRNPPTTSHTPWSDPGCTIFVKLWQFDPDDRAEVRVNMATAPTDADPRRQGVRIAPLYSDAQETVQMEHWSPGTSHAFSAPKGAELLVLEGNLYDGGDGLGRHDWLRLPAGEAQQLTAGSEGARIWVKTGHLEQVRIPA